MDTKTNNHFYNHLLDIIDTNTCKFKPITPNNFIKYWKITIWILSNIEKLQFGFKQKCFISHALINITKNIRKAYDDGNVSCRAFADLQKYFDTVDHQILLAKLNHHGICGVSNDWFQSHLSFWSCCYRFCCLTGICSRALSNFMIYKWP